MDVRHIAKLSNLSLTPDEEKKFNRQFSDTLAAIDLIKDLDTSSTPPTFQVTGLSNILRPDSVDRLRMLTQSEVLNKACKFFNGFVVVPSIFKQEDL